MTTSKSPVIIWFRQDLRLADNAALNAASLTKRPIIPLYILDDDGPPRPLGGALRWWLDKSLQALNADLSRSGSPLVLRRGDSVAKLLEVVAESGAKLVMWNRLYDQASIARDDHVREALQERGVEVQTFQTSVLNEPADVLVGGAAPYRVFTPYSRAAREKVGQPVVTARPVALTSPSEPLPSDVLQSWGLHPTKPDWSKGFDVWTPGEEGAHERLRIFLAGAAKAYSTGRNLMGEAGVSSFSPHLRFGEIGPRQIWTALDESAARGDIPVREAESLQRELLWRDFNYSLLFHNPTMLDRPFSPKFSGFAFKSNPGGFTAWSKGLTGYPVVDAAMRQLWVTGWTHNRARMIAASFLVKDLLIDWREGEAWFWDTLVDADLANNVTNWQWVAGSGADAAPFFRVFNPVLQGQKFDPRGAYVRKWVPELSGLSNADIHAPWLATPAALAAAHVKLGVDYPAPIVDHATARRAALAAYANLEAG